VRRVILSFLSKMMDWELNAEVPQVWCRDYYASALGFGVVLIITMVLIAFFWFLIFVFSSWNCLACSCCKCCGFTSCTYHSLVLRYTFVGLHICYTILSIVVFILYPDALDAAKKLPSPSSEELDWKDAGSFSETDNQWAWIAFMSVVLIFHFLMFLLLLAPCCRTVPLCFGLFRKVPEDIRKEARNSLPRNVQLVSSPSYNAAKPTIAQELNELNELKKAGGISADDYNINKFW